MNAKSLTITVMALASHMLAGCQTSMPPITITNTSTSCSGGNCTSTNNSTTNNDVRQGQGGVAGGRDGGVSGGGVPRGYALYAENEGVRLLIPLEEGFPEGSVVPKKFQAPAPVRADSEAPWFVQPSLESRVARMIAEGKGADPVRMILWLYAPENYFAMKAAGATIEQLASAWLAEQSVVLDRLDINEDSYAQVKKIFGPMIEVTLPANDFVALRNKALGKIEVIYDGESGGVETHNHDDDKPSLLSSDLFIHHKFPSSSVGGQGINIAVVEPCGRGPAWIGNYGLGPDEYVSLDDPCEAAHVVKVSSIIRNGPASGMSARGGAPGAKLGWFKLKDGGFGDQGLTYLMPLARYQVSNMSFGLAFEWDRDDDGQDRYEEYVDERFTRSVIDRYADYLATISGHVWVASAGNQGRCSRIDTFADVINPDDGQEGHLKCFRDHEAFVSHSLYNGFVVGATPKPLHIREFSYKQAGRADFSSISNQRSFGRLMEMPHLMARGQDVEVPGDNEPLERVLESGTSLSAPFVTSAVARIMAIEPHIIQRPHLAQAILFASADHMGTYWMSLGGNGDIFMDRVFAFPLPWDGPILPEVGKIINSPPPWMGINLDDVKLQNLDHHAGYGFLNVRSALDLIRGPRGGRLNPQQPRENGWEESIIRPSDFRRDKFWDTTNELGLRAMNLNIPIQPAPTGQIRVVMAWEITPICTPGDVTGCEKENHADLDLFFLCETKHAHKSFIIFGSRNFTGNSEGIYIDSKSNLLGNYTCQAVVTQYGLTSRDIRVAIAWSTK
ncbi:MAG: hypothetical protein GMKNLPBB_02556 [Myxococcota bacterium]|nr:hypothetical protein [Myxococcota bacterium]